MLPRSSLVCFVLFLLFGAVAVAELPRDHGSDGDSDDVINACVSKFDGFTRIVKNKKECIGEFEHFVQWNIQGVAGAMGAAGPAGPQGFPGMNGAPGAPGAMGLPGVAGSPGPAGPAGATGVPGAMGSPGLPGVAGSPGPAGAMGLAGSPGPQGLPGLIGPGGPAGAPGLPGSPGPQGTAGLPGSQGAPGSPGAPGAKGDTGNTGPAGPSGPTGPAGPQGPAGPAGTGAIPANLTALSGQLSTTNGVASLGSDRFRYQVDCQLGDMILSVNGYGSGALPADGRLLPINTYTAVFSIMGTNFGGNGITNFALPDLRAFAPKGLQYSVCVQGIFPSQN